MTSRALVLFSGGMDSATALAMTIADGLQPLALTFHYGQRHNKEVHAAERFTEHARVPHQIATVDLTWIGGSALTDPSIPLPTTINADATTNHIPSTYVPARNTIFLSYALAVAERTHINAIVIGANAIDYSGYPDCRPEYYRAFRNLARLATKRGSEGALIEIRTPLIAMSKADIVRRGEDLHVPWQLTWSCYRGTATACGRCDACCLRLKGFREAGITDPIPYDHTHPPAPPE